MTLGAAERRRRLLTRFMPTVLGVAALGVALIALPSGSGDPTGTATASVDGSTATTRPSLPAGASVTLEWVGDMAMSTQLGLPPGGVKHALIPVSGLLHDAQITTGNLEGTLSSGGVSPKCGDDIASGDCYAFQAPPSYAYGLRALGFRLVNQANNHSMDFGASGRRQTLAALRRAGVKETGLPGQITYVTTHGIKVAFLGFAPYPYDSSLLNIPRAKALVRTARAHAPLVVVIIHAGAEGASETHVPYGSEYFLGEDRGDSRAFARAVIGAGASIVVGSGPHVIRGIEDYRGHLIAYSLGNFIGYRTLGLGGVLSESAILRVKLGQGGKVLAARWIPILLDDGLPRYDGGNNSVRLVKRLSAEDFPRDHFKLSQNGSFELRSR